MSYKTQSRMAIDGDLRLRIGACAATQRVPNSLQWAADNQWLLAAEPGWDDAYSYALLVNENDPMYLPGADENVITDPMILAAVQKRLSESPVESEKPMGEGVVIPQDSPAPEPIPTGTKDETMDRPVEGETLPAESYQQMPLDENNI